MLYQQFPALFMGYGLCFIFIPIDLLVEFFTNERKKKTCFHWNTLARTYPTPIFTNQIVGTVIPFYILAGWMKEKPTLPGGLSVVLREVVGELMPYHFE
jgi:TRAP-type mannitol/chloroaromatic compound transport system permease large subunit